MGGSPIDGQRNSWRTVSERAGMAIEPGREGGFACCLCHQGSPSVENCSAPDGMIFSGRTNLD